MVISQTINQNTIKICTLIWQVIFVSSLLMVGGLIVYSQQNVVQNGNDIKNENVINIDEIKDGEIFSLGKTVIIKKGVKGVLVFGGDIIIDGRVEEDVAVIGGSITQKEGAFVGGDVIIFGGKYLTENTQPLRNSDKQTIIFFAGYEEELRNMMQNPLDVFSPQFSWSYLVWRIISILFWFLVTLTFTTLAPGSISRAVTRFQLTTVKIVGIGLISFFLITAFVITSLIYLPPIVGGLISIIGFFTILFAYFFGRVSLNASVGKFIQKKLMPEKMQSESLSMFIGTVVWVAILSIPYLGNLAVVLLFAASLGLVLTARSNPNWKSI